MFMKKLKERINLYIVRKPSRAILFGILVLNIVIWVVAASLISALAPPSLKDSGFWASIFYTIIMILDAGCIQYVVADIGSVSVALIVVCLLTVLIGMITFTGAMIGYVTNMFSNFIESSRAGERALRITGHTVILNWNSRASEIVHDMLYTGQKEVIVVLVSEAAQLVEREINERISETIRNEHLKNNLSIVVREGDTISSKQLADISLLQAKNVIILQKDLQNFTCKYDYVDRKEKMEQGNSNTIKTLVQVAEITSSTESADNQIIIVEVEDNNTMELVQKIISHKERAGKCNIVPVHVNRVLGQILSQFSIMPKLNTVYSELFSNRGAEFFCRDYRPNGSLDEKIQAYLAKHPYAIPLTSMRTKSGIQSFYVADDPADIDKTGQVPAVPEGTFELRPDYWIDQRNVIIIGHNSNCDEIMRGFDSFRSEWNYRDGGEILNILVIDDARSLEKHKYYRDYPYVRRCVEAEVFDSETISRAIEGFLAENTGSISILILSDNNAYSEDTDANALTYLIYVQDIIYQKQKNRDPDFDPARIDLIVEILNPKNFDVAHNFNANNVVISNRYISKMVTQISEKAALFEFYQDILVYDEFGGLEEPGEEEAAGTPERKEKEISEAKAADEAKTGETGTAGTVGTSGKEKIEIGAGEAKTVGMTEKRETETGEAGKTGESKTSGTEERKIGEPQKKEEAAGSLKTPEETDLGGKKYESKELYIKNVGSFLKAYPPECTAAELVRGVYHASPEDNRAIVIGYVDRSDVVHVFAGNQNDITVRLTDRDSLIIYSNH